MGISFARAKKPLLKRSRPFGGVLFACLALLTQMVVAVLPMPASAQTGWPICSVDPATKTHHTPHRTPIDSSGQCPVCLAHFFAGSTLPPPVPTLAAPAIVAANIVPVTILRATPTTGEFRPQQARAPPALIFLTILT